MCYMRYTVLHTGQEEGKGQDNVPNIRTKWAWYREFGPVINLLSETLENGSLQPTLGMQIIFSSVGPFITTMSLFLSF